MFSLPPPILPHPPPLLPPLLPFLPPHLPLPTNPPYNHVRLPLIRPRSSGGPIWQHTSYSLFTSSSDSRPSASTNFMAISLVVTTAEIGCPFPIGFPIVTMSGHTSVRVKRTLFAFKSITSHTHTAYPVTQRSKSSLQPCQIQSAPHQGCRGLQLRAHSCGTRGTTVLTYGRAKAYHNQDHHCIHNINIKLFMEITCESSEKLAAQNFLTFTSCNGVVHALYTNTCSTRNFAFFNFMSAGQLMKHGKISMYI